MDSTKYDREHKVYHEDVYCIDKEHEGFILTRCSFSDSTLFITDALVRVMTRATD